MVQPDALFKSLSKAIGLAAITVILLWLLYKVSAVLLLFLFAMVLVLVINAPVSWLENKGMKRGWACLLVFGCIFLMFGLLGWLVIPRVHEQLQALLYNLPGYVRSLSETLSNWVEEYPQLSKEIREEGYSVTQLMPSPSNLITRISNYSLSLFGFIFLSIIFICIVIYSVAKPRPLLQTYFMLFPAAKREKAEAALTHTSVMLTGWIRANLIGGSIEAVATTIFLTIMDVPGAWVWGAIALFAELIPNIGFYIMSVPPTLLALSVSPMTALWVFIFFLVLSEIMASIIMPRLIASTMDLHPVSTLFMLLVMGTAFGLIGALLTVPVTAIIKAYFSAFRNGDEAEAAHTDDRINKVLYHSNK